MILRALQRFEPGRVRWIGDLNLALGLAVRRQAIESGAAATLAGTHSERRAAALAELPPQDELERTIQRGLGRIPTAHRPAFLAALPPAERRIAEHILQSVPPGP